VKPNALGVDICLAGVRTLRRFPFLFVGSVVLVPTSRPCTLRFLYAKHLELPCRFPARAAKENGGLQRAWRVTFLAARP